MSVLSMVSISKRIAAAQQLDGPIAAVKSKVNQLLPPGPVKDLLAGTALGHPLHPVLTDIPIGSWTSAMALDLLGGRRARPAARALIGIGVVSALPTALSGLADGVDTEGATTRLVTVHALCNTMATVLYGASWWARRKGHHSRGVIIGFIGATAATIGAKLGGDLIYTQGVGVSWTAFDEPLQDWTEATGNAPTDNGSATVVNAGGVQVMVARNSHGELSGLAERCTHRGAPLHEGEIQGDCVTCPWHGSRFHLADGQIERGPATAPQPLYEVRENEGRLQVRSVQG